MSQPHCLPDHKPLTIIGLGNELLSDDGLGIRVVRELKKRLGGDRRIAFEELSVGGLQLLDYITGCNRCIIVDAIASAKEPAGTLYRFVQTPASGLVRLTSSHQIDLSQVLALGRLMGGALPEKLTVYGIEAEDVVTFKDGCTNQVARSIPKLVDLVCSDLEGEETDSRSGIGEWEIIHDIATT